MERINIDKSSIKFIRSYTTNEELVNWWNENRHSIGLAFVGRSNVGKSSLINALFGSKTARTSKTPGRTQAINIFTFELAGDQSSTTYYFYDLPGYGHAEVSKAMSKNWMQIMETFFANLNEATLLLNLQDARHPNQNTDQAFYKYINPKYIDIFLVFNKMDKLKKQKERAALNKLKPKIFQDYKFVKNIFFISAEKKTGVEPLEQALISHCLTWQGKLNNDYEIEKD